jgi:soluble lytic murein transglycosylase-like protein
MVLGASPKPKASPHLSNPSAGTKAEVHVSLDSFAALPPSLAYDDIIEEAAALFQVDADLIHAVIETESSFNPLAESARGAQGLMQLTSITQAELGVLNPFDPRENIMAGTAYLKKLLDRHNGNIALALASYNAGPGNVRRFRGVPPFRETRNYIKKIKTILAESGGD